jgi:hypothetical protein
MSTIVRGRLETTDAHMKCARIAAMVQWAEHQPAGSMLLQHQGDVPCAPAFPLTPPRPYAA